MASDDNAHVSFSNDVDIEEATPAKSGTDGPELSQSAKAWDINCDGELNDTEKALKDLDKTGKGTLSKDQMYQLMHENRAVQKELGRMKKWVIGLVVFTALLALANVGMSFAAAFLAKDTSTEEGKLVDKSGATVKTDSTTEVFMVDNDLQNQVTRERRRLCLTGSSTSCNVGQTPWGSVSSSDAKKIITQCSDGGNVALGKEYPLPGGEWKSVIHRICPADDITTSTNKGDQSMTINREGGRPPITITPSTTVNNVHEVDGLGELGDSCQETQSHNNNDCGAYMKCESATSRRLEELGDIPAVGGASSTLGNVCVRSIDHTCSGSGQGDCGSNLICESGFCKGDYLHQCVSDGCSTGLTCETHTVYGDVCVGTVALGGDCSADPCGTNLKCEDDGTGSRTCVGDLGFSCTDGGAECGGHAVCESDVCKGVQGATCPLTGTGSECHSDFHCFQEFDVEGATTGVCACTYHDPATGVGACDAGYACLTDTFSCGAEIADYRPSCAEIASLSGCDAGQACEIVPSEGGPWGVCLLPTVATEATVRP